MFHQRASKGIRTKSQHKTQNSAHVTASKKTLHTTKSKQKNKNASSHQVTQNAAMSTSVPTLLPSLRQKHAKDIDRLAEVIQAKKFQSWLSEQSYDVTEEGISKLRDAGLSHDDAKTILTSAMVTFLVHVESRISSSQGQGFYTIGPCGEELMGTVGLNIRSTDAMALHYRHVATQVTRQLQAGRNIDDILLDRARGHTVSINDPVTGGAHCAIGGGEYDFLVTSTLASQSTPAVGRAMGQGLQEWIKKQNSDMPSLFPNDMVSFVSLGDGSINNGHFLSAVNLAEYATYRKFKCPVVFCITDNEISISLRGFGYLQKQFINKFQIPVYKANGTDTLSLLTESRQAIDYARTHGKPVVLYINNITRRFGHAATDRQAAYMPQSEITSRSESNPIEGLSRLLAESGVMSLSEQSELFKTLWEKTTHSFDLAAEEPKITSRQQLKERLSIPLRPLPDNITPIGPNESLDIIKTSNSIDTATADNHTKLKNILQTQAIYTHSNIQQRKTKNNPTLHLPDISQQPQSVIEHDRSQFNNIQTRVSTALSTPRNLALDTTMKPAGTALAIPQAQGRDVMRKHMTQLYHQLMSQYPQMVYIGEDVTHGGYYLVSDGLNQAYPGRVRDFAPDETALLGAAMGFSQQGLIPICEIPYIKYLDCAMDILTEAGIMSWLSNRQQPNGMIIRCQGFGSGVFGGNYHTTNLIYTMPGFDVVCYSNGQDYARGMRYAALQASQGRVIMSIDSTSLLNHRHVNGMDDAWRKPYTHESEYMDFDQVGVYYSNGQPRDMSQTTNDKTIAVVTYGDGVISALQAAEHQRKLNEADNNTSSNTKYNIDVIDCQLLNRVPQGLKDIISSYNGVVFADPCKDGMQPLANHAVLLQRDGLLSTSWSNIGAQPTYNPLGTMLTFLNTQDILHETDKVAQRM